MKKHTKILRSLVAVLLAFLMVGTLIPATAFAASTSDEIQGEIVEHVNFLESVVTGLRNFFQRMIDFFKNLFGIKDEEIPVVIPTDNKYYASISDAVGDINAGTAGENADALEETAEVAMYEDENGKFVVELLKDIRLDSTLTISSDATIVLNGYALSANGISAIEITDGDVVINGVENGSEIYVANAGSARAVLLSGGNAQLISGAYSITSANNTSCIGVSGGEMKIDGAVISANGASGNVRGIDIGAQGTAYIDNSDIKAFCTGANAYGINAYGKLTIDNSKVFVNGDTKTRALIVAKGATANASNSEFIGYTTILVKVTRSSQGISNSGKLTINDCYAYGNHSGISNAGELYIKGGTYESPGNGGIYFGNIGTPAYVYDATIRRCPQKEGLDASQADFNDAGFYIGGGSDRNNVVVFMDNCDIGGDVWAITLRGTSNEHDNALYISNSRLTGKGYVRVDNNTHRLFIGAGNNFTINDVADLSKNPLDAGTVIITDATYRY